MRRVGQRFVMTLAILFVASIAIGQARDFRSIRLVPDEFRWVAGPNGVSRVDLAGSQSTPGLYAYRLRLPRGYRARPHSHPDDRVVTVISGVFYVGLTDRFDETVVKRLPPGSIWTEPAGQPHYGWAKDGEVEIHVVGYGPSGTTLAPR
jgi:quercetin dioxygenase-like cupin family protein